MEADRGADRFCLRAAVQDFLPVLQQLLTTTRAADDEKGWTHASPQDNVTQKSKLHTKSCADEAQPDDVAHVAQQLLTKEVDQLISRVLHSHFSAESILDALHPPDAHTHWCVCTPSDTHILLNAEEAHQMRRVGENGATEAVSDLYAARTCDALREGGGRPVKHAAHATQPEVVQQLDLCLHEYQKKVGLLQQTAAHCNTLHRTANRAAARLVSV